MDIYDARKTGIQPAVLTGSIYKVVKHVTGELSIYLDTGYEIVLDKAEAKQWIESI